MKKFLLELFLGFFFCFASIYSGYIFLSTYNEQASAVPLVISVLLLGLSIFFILLAARTEMNFAPKPKDSSKNPPEKHQSIFERNNQLVSSWRKTEEQKERLRLLKLAGEMNNE